MFISPEMEKMVKNGNNRQGKGPGNTIVQGAQFTINRWFSRQNCLRPSESDRSEYRFRMKPFFHGNQPTMVGYV